MRDRLLLLSPLGGVHSHHKMRLLYSEFRIGWCDMEDDQKLKGPATSPPGREGDGLSGFLVGFSQLLKALFW